MKKGLLFLGLMIGMFSVASANIVTVKDTAALREYVGHYKFTDGSVVPDVTVSMEDTVLSITSSAGASAMQKLGEDLYTIVQFEGSTAKFNRDSNKKVIGISIKAMGYELEGVKDAAPASLSELAKYFQKRKELSTNSK
jgi:hypothetical protein